MKLRTVRDGTDGRQFFFTQQRDRSRRETPQYSTSINHLAPRKILYCFSEKIFQSELDHPSVGGRSEAAEARRRVKIGAGRAKVRPIQQVEKFASELDFVRLTE